MFFPGGKIAIYIVLEQKTQLSNDTIVLQKTNKTLEISCVGIFTPHSLPKE
jgi:hypothetical protein